MRLPSEHPYDEYVRHTRLLDPEHDSDWRRRELVGDEVWVALPGGRVGRVVPVEDVEQAEESRRAAGLPFAVESGSLDEGPPNRRDLRTDAPPPAERPEDKAA